MGFVDGVRWELGRNRDEGGDWVRKGSCDRDWVRGLNRGERGMRWGLKRGAADGMSWNGGC